MQPPVLVDIGQPLQHGQMIVFDLLGTFMEVGPALRGEVIMQRRWLHVADGLLLRRAEQARAGLILEEFSQLRRLRTDRERAYTLLVLVKIPPDVSSCHLGRGAVQCRTQVVQGITQRGAEVSRDPAAHPKPEDGLPWTSLFGQDPYEPVRRKSSTCPAKASMWPLAQSAFAHHAQSGSSHHVWSVIRRHLDLICLPDPSLMAVSNEFTDVTGFLGAGPLALLDRGRLSAVGGVELVELVNQVAKIPRPECGPGAVALSS
jgi:hypothetical protein